MQRDGSEYDHFPSRNIYAFQLVVIVCMYGRVVSSLSDQRPLSIVEIAGG